MNFETGKLGLVLSGGGVRGIAHIGAIKALIEHGIEPEIVSGSSAGAVVGALYCSGYSPEEMREFFRITPLFHINRFAFSKPGFIDTDKFYPDFKKYFEIDDFSALQKQLFVTTVDICDGVLKVFNDGELIRPLLASCAFPGLFTPVTIDKSVYADGGILDNFPTAPVKDICSLLVGVYASPLSKIDANGLRYSVNVLERAIRINYSKRSHAKFSDCELMINPLKLVNYGLLDVGKMDEIYEIGYQSATEALLKIDNLEKFQNQPKH